MSTIIDRSFLWGELSINNVIEASSGTVLNEAAGKNSSELELMIEKYTYQFLFDNFGEELADDFPVELEEYIKNDIRKSSPIANLVYFHYVTSKQTMMTPSGNKQTNIQNTFNSAPVGKLVRAWNEMVDMNIKLHKKLRDMEEIPVGDETLSYEDDILPNINYESPIFEYINTLNV